MIQIVCSLRRYQVHIYPIVAVESLQVINLDNLICCKFPFIIFLGLEFPYNCAACRPRCLNWNQQYTVKTFQLRRARNTEKTIIKTCSLPGRHHALAAASPPWSSWECLTPFSSSVVYQVSPTDQAVGSRGIASGATQLLCSTTRNNGISIGFALKRFSITLAHLNRAVKGIFRTFVPYCLLSWIDQAALTQHHIFYLLMTAEVASLISLVVSWGLLLTYNLNVFFFY